VTLTQTEEDRVLRDYEGMYHNRAKRYDIPGLDHDDKVQQARIAALIALRKFNPDIPRANLSGWLRKAVEMKLSRLRWQATCPKFSNKVQDNRNLSLDYPLTEGEDDLLGDITPGRDRADCNLLLMACESLCRNDLELAILEVAQSKEGGYGELETLFGVAQQYVSKAKVKLMRRLREELFA
jgi:hypothetical protein